MRTLLALSLCALAPLAACRSEVPAPARVDIGDSGYTVPERPGLGVGDRAPRVTLVDDAGSPVRLGELYDDGPVVLTFYRGGWCPYCNDALSAWRGRLDELERAGATLVAVSPEKPGQIGATKDKNELSTVVLSDTTGEAARAFRVQFALDDATIKKYRGYGIDLEAHNADGEWTLPAPATFVIDGRGVVRWAWADWDYTRRADPDDAIEAVKKIAG